MSTFDQKTDKAILSVLGARLTSARLALNLTQAELAHRAGVSKRTVERLESGQSTQLTNFIRILRTLDLIEGFALLLPPPQPSPMDLLRLEGNAPQRATGSAGPPQTPWTWADDT